MNDLFRYVTTEARWENLTDRTQGATPAPRDSHSFAAVGGRLFVFGGYSGGFSGASGAV